MLEGSTTVRCPQFKPRSCQVWKIRRRSHAAPQQHDYGDLLSSVEELSSLRMVHNGAKKD